MSNILDELYHQYFRPVPQPEAQREIDESHQQLIGRLGKPERKLILCIMDNKDMIAGESAKESFQCGFWLAWQLCTQIHSYNSDRSFEEFLNAGDRSVMPQNSEKDTDSEKTADDSCFKDLE